MKTFGVSLLLFLILSPYLGTKMEVMAWTHATSFVTDQISLMLSFPENRHQYLELNIHERLSLADGIVLVQCLGITKAADFVGSVDPWLYPDGKTPGPGCRRFTQSAVDKATVAGKQFFNWTEESKTAYLLSALLVPNSFPSPNYSHPRHLEVCLAAHPAAAWESPITSVLFRPNFCHLFRQVIP